jgi:RNA polymerase sigma factor (TIGR02999 family)
MADVTRLLLAEEDGPHKAEQLIPLVYDELRKLAAQRLRQEQPGQTMQATSLVHEAFVRLVDQDRVQLWENRRHFFAAAAEAMRRILIERARARKTEKRGGLVQRLDLELSTWPMTSAPASSWLWTRPWPLWKDTIRKPPSW